MKAWLLILAALIVGLGAGIGAAFVRIGAPDTETLLSGRGIGRGDPRMPAAAPQDGPQPKAVVDDPDYDFGQMDAHTTGRHDFVITNQGEHPLELSEGDTTCKCTLSKLRQKTIDPGESGTVTIEWTAKDFLGPYRQTATVFTNDPDQPRLTLTVSGNITAAVRAVPSQLVFTRIPAGQSSTGYIHLYGYLDEPLSVEDVQIADPRAAEYFDLKLQSLAAEDLADEPQATSGQLLEVTVKPGLPLGGFQETITLRPNLGTTKVLEIPVEGKIGSDISVVGRGYDADSGVLRIGTVARSEGARRKLIIVVRGPKRKAVDFRVDRVVPELLQVELGPVKPVNDGAVLQAPLTIEIPPGSPTANFLGTKTGKLGRIEVLTGHPLAPRLEIRVRFAIEG